MHLTLFFGAFVMAALGILTVGLALLVILKIIADVWSHVREHRKIIGQP